MKHFIVSLIFCFMLAYPSAAAETNNSIGWLMASSSCSEKDNTKNQFKRCSILNKHSKHHEKLKEALKRLGESIRKPILIPKGVRRQQMPEQRYIK